jgi:CheY-like chemotaxis protein
MVDHVQAPSSETDREVRGGKPPVLIVDDTVELRELLVEIVQLHGFPVLSARDGAEALRVVRASRPAIVLLDMHMPEMDGLEFLERLGDVAGDGALPVVIAMSADPTFAKLSKDRGALDFLEKPIDDAVLAAALAEASAGRCVAPELRARHLDRIRDAFAEDDQRRDEIFAHSRVTAPEFRSELVLMLRWIADYFDVPLALVNLLRGGRVQPFETYASAHGDGMTLAPSAEDDGYCADFTRNGESLVLRDASAHPLYRDRDATRHGVRFYCSAPLRTTSKLSLGTLSLESPQPVDASTFRTEDLLLLRYFADTVGDSIRASESPEVSPAFFPDANLLDGEAFRAVVASRLAAYSPDAFPFVIAKLKGTAGTFVPAAGAVFERLATRHRTAIARQASASTVAWVGSSEGLATFEGMLRSQGLAFTNQARTVASATVDDVLAEL